MVCSNVRIFVPTKTNIMKTQNTKNNMNTNIFAYIITTLTFAFIIGASIEILSNL